MVVHTPSKLEVLRQTAAQRRAADATGTSDAPDVPPSVLAANADAVTPVEHTEDLLAGEIGDDTEHHDFDVWDGENPPGVTARADVHNAETERRNVTTRRANGPVRFNDLTNASGESSAGAQRSGGLQDQDKISVVLSLIHI